MAGELNDLLKQLAAKSEADIIRRIRQLNLIDTGQLLKSINVAAKTTGETSITIQHNYVTVFIETVSGKGQKAGQTGTRKKTPVISDISKKLRQSLYVQALSISNGNISGLIKVEFNKEPRE